MMLYRITVTKLILVFGLFRDECAGKEVFALLGGQAELDPKVGRKQIFSITWMSGPHKAAEWDSPDTQVDYFKMCEHKCELNIITGVLTIKLLMVDDNKNYSVEINGAALPIHFQLTVLSPVRKPSITPTCNETACTLSCDGEEAKHASWKLLWKENDKESSGERVWTVWKSDHLDKTYSCIWRNPLDEAKSKPISEKDLFPQNSLRVKSWTLILAVCALASAVPLGAGVSRSCRVLRRTEAVNNIYENIQELGVQNHFDSGVTEAMNIIYENTKDLRVQEHYQSGVTGADVRSVYDTVTGSQAQNHQCSAVTVLSRFCWQRTTMQVGCTLKMSKTAVQKNKAKQQTLGTTRIQPGRGPKRLSDSRDDDRLIRQSIMNQMGDAFKENEKHRVQVQSALFITGS